MKHRFLLQLPFFLLPLLVCAIGCRAVPLSSSPAECAGWLLPTPKRAVFAESFALRDASFRIDNRFGGELDADRLALFAETLASRLGWQPKQDASYTIRLEKLPASPALPGEYYELKIAPRGIRIAAASLDGMMRGLSRISALTLTPLARRDAEGRIVLRAMELKDYPDNPVRIFHVNLRQVFPKKSKKEMLLSIAHEMIDRAAEMQFNHVMIAVGGNMKFEGHPEINPAGPVFEKDEIRALVRRATLRGVQPMPLLNSIGHAAHGPYICPIYDPKNPKKIIGTNVADPAFFPLFFRYIDELAELFPGAKYFGIGTDEFHSVSPLIEKLSGKKCEEFYPEYVNKVAAHLKPKGMKTMIYHDMMGPTGRYKWPTEILNGPKGAMEMLKAFDKENVVVGYWNYFHAHDYQFIKDLLDAGFPEIWFTGWYGEAGIQALYGLGHKLKQPLFTTQWSAVPARNEFIHGAEFSWNAASKKSTEDFNDFNEACFYRRPRGNFLGGGVETVTLTGGYPLFAESQKALGARFGGARAATAFGLPVDFGSARSFTETAPEPEPVAWSRLAELNKAGTLKNYTIFTPGSIVRRLVGKKSGVDVPRQKGQFTAFFTSAYGKSTGTNNRGVEFSVDADGRVAEFSGNVTGRSGDETGDMTIPPGGFVVSWSEAQPCFFLRAHTFYQTLRKGDPLWLVRRDTGKMLRTTVRGKLAVPRRGAAVFLWAAKPMEPGFPLVRLRFTFADGKQSKAVPVTGTDFITAPVLLRDNPPYDSYIAWPMVRYGLNPVLAVEWNQPAGAPPITEVSVQCSDAGVSAGISVLGVTAFEENGKAKQQ